MLKENADIGVAMDGDGDRLIMVDNKGNEIDGDDILYIIGVPGSAPVIWKAQS